MQMSEQHLFNFWALLTGNKDEPTRIWFIKELLQNQHFEPLIGSESETGVLNFPWNPHRV